MSNPNNIESLPPIWPSQTFNSSLFQSSGYITRQQADLLYASTYSIRNIKYINDVTEGTVSPQKAIITNSSNNITGINSITMNGSLNVVASCFLGTTSKNICIGTSTDTTRLISALDSALANGSSNSICFGKANSAGNQAEFTYTVEATATNNKLSIGFHSNNLITMFNRTSGGQLMYLCNSPLAPTAANVNILRSLAFTDNSSNYARFTYGANNLQIDFVNSSGAQQSTYMMENDSLSLGPGLLVPQFRLDLGSKGAITGNNDFLVSLFNSNNTSPTTGLGFTSGDNLFISSGGSNGIIFRNTHGLTGAGANINRGTKTHQMYKTGHFEATSGIRAGEFSTVPYTGKGVEIHWSTSSNLGDVFAYDRTGGTFLPLRISSTIYTTPSNNRVGINVSSPTVALDVSGNVLITSSSGIPLVVSGTGTATRSGTYGWLGPSGAGNATGFTNRAFSIQSSGGILADAGEIDSFSDIRMKKNIVEIDDTKALRLLNINPISFLYNKQDNNEIPYIGYRAQDFVKHLFNDVVGFTNVNEDIKLEKQTITTIEGTEIILDEDIKLTINQFGIIPYLHKLVKIQHKRIEENNIIIKNLQTEVKNIQTELDGAYDMITDIQKTITELHPNINFS